MAENSKYLEEYMKKQNNFCQMQVVFVDIISYSKRKSTSQVRVIHAFMDIIKKTLLQTGQQYLNHTQEIEAHLNRDVIVLPTGDGAAIAFPFGGVRQMHLFFARTLIKKVNEANIALNCDKYKAGKVCNQHPTFQLRCGISEGPTILYKDLNNQFNLAGQTINMAARVMDKAGANQIIFTKDAYETIIDTSDNIKPKESEDCIEITESMFKKYQQLPIKHGEKIEVYQYIDSRANGLNIDPLHIPVITQEQHTNSSPLNVDIPVTYEAIIKKLQDNLVKIPAGQVLIEKEKLLIKISKPFLINRYLIKQTEYSAVMGSNPSQFPTDKSLSTEDLPVENISWQDATDFCNKLSELSNLEPVYKKSDQNVEVDFNKNGYRLPTEIEWQYCCQAGDTSDIYGPIDEIAWHSLNITNQPQKVGSKMPNCYGLYDMLGNLWEWCNDRYQRNYPKGPLIDYIGPDSGFERVLRGGSWASQPTNIRAGLRERKVPTVKTEMYGFRVVLPIK